MRAMKVLEDTIDSQLSQLQADSDLRAMAISVDEMDQGLAAKKAALAEGPSAYCCYQWIQD